jgi:hypothetical protein
MVSYPAYQAHPVPLVYSFFFLFSARCKVTLTTYKESGRGRVRSQRKQGIDTSCDRMSFEDSCQLKLGFSSLLL